MDIRIFVSCHKDSYVPQNSLLFPIQVGCKKSGKHLKGFLHDDEGENISEKNPMYCELTAQYWAWKNVDADYYGFFHYRRYFNFSETVFPAPTIDGAEFDWLNESSANAIGLDSKKMASLIEKYDCIAPTFVDLKKINYMAKSVYRQYSLCSNQKKEDLDLVLEIIKEKYPDCYSDAKKYLNSSKGVFCNMFIMKKALFNEYCEWLFSILFEHEKRRGVAAFNKAELRVSGYLGERLFGIWYSRLKKRGFKCMELQRTFFKNTEHIEVPAPWFKERNIAVVFQADDSFAPYLAASIYSLVQNSSTENDYDILILSKDFSEKNKALYEKLFNRKNVNVRFVNPLAFAAVFPLQEILKCYEKVLFLDSMLIIKDDVAKLFNEDVKGVVAAGVMDIDGGEDSVLDGVFLLNLNELRKMPAEQCADFCSLNALCKGRTKFFDMSWNVLADYDGVCEKKIVERAPARIFEMYTEARKIPKIINFAGKQKPWTVPDMDFAFEWWEYQRALPYYEIVLQKCVQQKKSSGKSESVIKRIYHNFFPTGTFRWYVTQRIIGKGGV